MYETASDQMIASLSGQTLLGPVAACGEVWVACPNSPLTWGLFFGVGPAMASLYKNSGGAPFVRAGTPDPSLALITADQFDNRIDCEKDFFIQFPRRPYSQWKRKYSAISYPRSERGLAKKEAPQKREKSPTLFFPFTVFPLSSPIHIWLQRLFDLKKAFVCPRSYWSLINCKLVRHQVSVPSVGKAGLEFFFFFLNVFFAHFAPVTLKRNVFRAELRKLRKKTGHISFGVPMWVF